MISGMYMGEIARLVIEKLRKGGHVFGGKGSNELSERGRFYTKYVSEIERFVFQNYRQSISILYKKHSKTSYKVLFTLYSCCIDNNI